MGTFFDKYIESVEQTETILYVGSVISVKIITESMGNSVQILIAASVSAVIAALTIFGKAAMKKVAMENSTKVILTVGKILSIFTRNHKK